MVLRYIDNIKTPTYYLLKIIEDINFVIDNTIEKDLRFLLEQLKALING